MTAINLIVQPHAVTVFTDSAGIDHEGKIIGFGPKVDVWPHLPAGVAVRGTFAASTRALVTLNALATSFDLMVDQGPTKVVRAVRDIVGPHGPSFDLVLFGWSEDAQAFQAHQLEWRGQADPLGWTSQNLRSLVTPHDGNIATAMANAGIAPGKPLPSPREFGRLVMTAQRSVASEVPSGFTVRSVGGHCQMVTMRRESILTEVIQHWPEDRIGRRIGEIDPPRPTLLPGLPVGRT